MEFAQSTGLLLILTLALLGQYPAAAHSTGEEAGWLKTLLQRFRSSWMQNNESPPSSPPKFDDNAAEVDGLDIIDNPGGVHHSINVDTFKIGYEASYEIKAAPNTGRVSFDLIDDINQKIILHVDARYNWYSWNNVLVLNGYNGGWGTEQRPSGFDFTPGKRSVVTVRADEDGFRILQHGCDIALFPYRSGLPISSVSRIRIRSEGSEAAQDASLNIDFD